jgi:hypothetical protein
MRRAFFGTLVAGTLLLSGSAQASLSMTAIVRDHNLSATEAAAAILIADALKLDATFVINTSKSTGMAIVDIGPAFYISHHTHRPVTEVCKKRKGKGWGVIAKEMGMHPGTFNKMRVQGDFDRVCWVNLANSRYRLTDRDFKSLESHGMGRGDVLATFVISGGDRNKFSGVVGEWKKDKSWKSRGKGGGKSGSGDKGDSKGKGNSGGKGNSDGKGNSGGKGGSGGGKGKGKG